MPNALAIPTTCPCAIGAWALYCCLHSVLKQPKMRTGYSFSQAGCDTPMSGYEVVSCRRPAHVA